MQIIKAFIFDFTIDLTDSNILSKIEKYQRYDVFLFIVGYDWTLSKQIGNIPKDSKILYPENIRVMNNLALFLIKHDINVNEGMELITRALELEPDNWNFLYTHGLGLYQQGKLNETQVVLDKSWEIRPYYNHDHYLLIQEVEQALARQNQ